MFRDSLQQHASQTVEAAITRVSASSSHRHSTTCLQCFPPEAVNHYQHWIKRSSHKVGVDILLISMSNILGLLCTARAWYSVIISYMYIYTHIFVFFSYVTDLIFCPQIASAFYPALHLQSLLRRARAFYSHEAECLQGICPGSRLSEPQVSKPWKKCGKKYLKKNTWKNVEKYRKVRKCAVYSNAGWTDLWRKSILCHSVHCTLHRMSA